MEQYDKKEIQDLRSCIESFLKKRCDDKIAKQQKEKADDDELAKTREKYLRENWLADAAKRASWIHLVTHAVKYGHPNAKGNSLYNAEASVQEGYVCTASCSVIHEDVVGNAAALDVYTFLKLEHEGKTLLQRVMDKDAALLAAFSDDRALAESWMESFGNMLAKEGDGSPASHTLARQVYFPLDEGGYHLLAPLFPTSLVHYVYMTMQKDKEGRKEARDARKAERMCSHGYHEYPHLLIQKFGGSKPQNISQLNTERHGENWLLPSCPPIWDTDRVRLPLGIKSVFGPTMEKQPEIRNARKHLVDFLERTAGEYTNVRIRETRASLLDDLITAVMQWAARIRSEPSGWTADERCCLPEEECFWLDPRRGEIDQEWQRKRNDGQWMNSLLDRAAFWCNRLLSTKKLAMGDEEYFAWKKELTEALSQLEDGEMA